jgi:lipid-binding SYLF domain-containing protein
MTDRGLASFHRSSLKLGVDASIAAGSDGNRIGADTSLRLSADIVVFARSKGAFMGISLEEAVVRIVDSANETYYGRPLRPAEIFTAETTLPHSLDLLQSVEALTR